MSLALKTSSENNLDDTFLSCREKADQGLITAQYQMGKHYEEGKLTSRSYQEAVKYYKIAADKGYAKAQYSLAKLLKKGLGIEKSLPESFRYFQLAANQGHRFAMRELGVYYLKGLGIKKCPKKGVAYFLLAEKKGVFQALLDLTDIYENGWGVEKSSEKAQFYRKRFYDSLETLAEKGEAHDQLILGLLFATGEHGVEKSPEKAFHYFQLSAEQHHLLGEFKLADCYENGIGIAPSIEKAQEYFKRSAAQGNTEALYRLCKLLEQTDPKLAIDYLQRIGQSPYECKQSLLADSQFLLGKIFEKNKEEKDANVHALYYYQEAAENGSRLAQERLLKAFLDGELGLEPSKEEAQYYNKLLQLWNLSKGHKTLPKWNFIEIRIQKVVEEFFKNYEYIQRWPYLP